MRKFAVAVLFLPPLLAGCSHTPSVQKVVEPYTYKIDIQQGNVVTQEMVAKLRQGMTPAQVRYVMGSPLVTDAFHPDRWDYVYVYEKGHKVTERRRVTVIFADGKLDRLDGDIQLQDTLMEQTPAPAAPAAAPVTSAPAATSPTETATTTAPIVSPAATNPAAAPVTSAPAAALPEAAAAPAVVPTETPQPETAGTTKAAAPDDVAKSGQEEKPKQRGFFGRMLDKIGL